jgi:hypothetical protein
VVLEASSASALTGWLKEHGYAFSPEVEAWAKPYVDGGWKITALRVAKDASKKAEKRVAAAALRISFKTDRPLFPYREPESKRAADSLGVFGRMLRIYFVGDGRYDGALSKDGWTGSVAWAGELRASDRSRLADTLKIPAAAIPEKAWMTEFEDPWPYRAAPSDLYFAKTARQDTVKRPPIIEYTLADSPDTTWLLAGVVFVPGMARRWSRAKRNNVAARCDGSARPRQ